MTRHTTRAPKIDPRATGGGESPPPSQKADTVPKRYKNLDDVRKLYDRIGTEAIQEEAGAVMKVSQDFYVPIDTGQLHDTGEVIKVRYRAGRGGAVLRFGGPGAPYAAIVHENPRAGKTGGVSPSGQKYLHWARTGQWKYLEIPVRRASVNFSKRVASRMNRKLR